MIAVLGSGAFGTALAVAYARDGAEVVLWGRNRDAMKETAETRRCPRLPGIDLPRAIVATADLHAALDAGTVLLALPMQKLGAFLAEHGPAMGGRNLVACCKGVDLTTLDGPTALIARHCPDARPALLTGPSFAADIARGLPTALTLACAGPHADALQSELSNNTLRLYLTDDLPGAELGGALKNVVAIACGAAIGAGLGESARAAVMTRGYAEMQRFALARGARAETLSGLSGFGDLALTCTSEKSRNFRYGLALGAGSAFDTSGTTVEGAATAQAVVALSKRYGLEMPLTETVAQLVSGQTTVDRGVHDLMARPLKRE